MKAVTSAQRLLRTGYTANEPRRAPAVSLRTVDERRGVTPAGRCLLMALLIIPGCPLALGTGRASSTGASAYVRTGTPAGVSTGISAASAGAAASAGTVPSGETAASPVLLAEFRKDPMEFFFNLRGNEAILCGQSLLRENDLAPEERRRVLTTLASIYLSTGRAAQARAAFQEILTGDPTADLDTPADLPPPVVGLFYSIRDSMLLAGGEGSASDLHTLAVGEIENNSIVRGKYDLERFARGLSQVLMTDLQGTTPLKLVDRQRLAVLRQEIGLSQNGMVTDPKYAVPFGRLSGAQSYLFGSLMQVDEEKIRLDLRWVNTSTTEVLLSEGVEAKLRSSDDLFALERKVLVDLLLPQIRRMLAASGEEPDLKGRIKPYLESKQKRLSGRDTYVEFLLKTGDAVLAEQRGDWGAAQVAWNEVRALNPQDPTASGRARALTAYMDFAAREEER